MNPKAWMKSANLYSLCSLPFTTVHPLRAATAFFSSGPESFGILPLSFAPALLVPQGIQRIDARCAARGNHHRNQGHRNQNECDGGENQRVRRADFEQEALQHARQ